MRPAVRLDETEGMPIGLALEALTAELRRTVEYGQMLEDFMSSLAPLLPKGAALEELQAVDALVQMIDNLAIVSGELAKAAQGSDACVDFAAVLAKVKLSDMANRIRGSVHQPFQKSVNSGELDLF